MNKTKAFGNTRLLLAGALVLGTISVPASAQTSGYLLDQRGAAVKSSSNLCWRTGYWSPAMATQECDPDLVPRKPVPLKPPAPRAKPPAPPAPQAKPPAPPPRRVMPVTQKVTLSADALFDFDKSVIRPDGRARLDQLVNSMKGVSVETIIAIGHADRIGSERYNMKLSQRRADSVKAYLVSKGVPANRIHTEGRGEKEPVTKPGTCKGSKSPKLIACLQPDRRVVIEVVGTRTK